MTPDSKNETPQRVGPVAPLFGGIEAKLWRQMQMKADLFDYLCWLEDFCAFRQAALDGKVDDYLVLASDGTTCWGKTYAEAVRVAMEHDKEIFDATQSSPNDQGLTPRAKPEGCQ